MRTHLFGAFLRGMLFRGGNKYLTLVQTLGGTFTITKDMPHMMFLDPGGAARTVVLPAEADSKGLFFFIYNTADGFEDLTVKEDSSTTTIGVIPARRQAVFYCDGTTWTSNLPTTTGNITSAAAFTSLATAGAATYTAAQILSGVIVRDPAGAGRTDVLPTAALLVAAIPNAQVGMVIRCNIINGADAAETITVDAGSGGTYDTNQTAASRVVPQNASKVICIRLTNVTASSEAYAVAM